MRAIIFEINISQRQDKTYKPVVYSRTCKQITNSKTRKPTTNKTLAASSSSVVVLKTNAADAHPTSEIRVQHGLNQSTLYQRAGKTKLATVNILLYKFTLEVFTTACI
jgi:hypothetical protein